MKLQPLSVPHTSSVCAGRWCPICLERHEQGTHCLWLLCAPLPVTLGHGSNLEQLPCWHPPKVLGLLLTLMSHPSAVPSAGATHLLLKLLAQDLANTSSSTSRGDFNETAPLSFTGYIGRWGWPTLGSPENCHSPLALSWCHCPSCVLWLSLPLVLWNPLASLGNSPGKSISPSTSCGWACLSPDCLSRDCLSPVLSLSQAGVTTWASGLALSWFMTVGCPGVIINSSLFDFQKCPGWGSKLYGHPLSSPSLGKFFRGKTASRSHFRTVKK